MTSYTSNDIIEPIYLGYIPFRSELVRQQLFRFLIGFMIDSAYFEDSKSDICANLLPRKKSQRVNRCITSWEQSITKRTVFHWASRPRLNWLRIQREHVKILICWINWKKNSEDVDDWTRFNQHLVPVIKRHKIVHFA